MIKCQAFSRVTILMILFLHGDTATAGATDPTNDHILHDHLRGLVNNKAHTFPHAAPLPLAAAGPILHVDLALLSHKPELQATFFETLLKDEVSTRAAAPSDSRYPYVLCGPQFSSSKARREISAASGPSHRTQVMYSSRPLDVACWKGYLQYSNAIELESSDLFFHVAPIPKISKLAPGLVQRLEHYEDGNAGATERLKINPLALSNGLTVFFNPSSSSNERLGLIHKWSGTGYGLTSSSAVEESFVPLAWAKSTADVAPWAGKSTAGLDCLSVLSVNPMKSNGGVSSLVIEFELLVEDDETTNTCFIAVLLHLASSSEVAGLEVTKKMRSQGQLKESKSNHLRGQLSLEDRRLQSVPTDPGALNFIAVTALQSGNASKPYPFWSAGIDGSNQSVQVADTGFDDASCFFRDTDASKSFLTGPFDFDVQIPRSTYDSPITDLSRRKIVQYIEFSNSSDSYAYDYVDGHGTHVAGTVAGQLSSDENNVTVKNYYSLCSDHSSQCDTYFCATCPYPNYCDGMCGFLDGEDFTGMAPSAKIMAFDFGDGSGALAPISDYDSMMYAPAYDAGARVFCNSWGSVGAYYNSVDGSWIGSLYDSASVMMDTLIYNYDDALVVFAAGNEGSFDGSDDTTGDHSILDPGTTKNVLTVGAAETQTTPSTVASFSSRGPTTDFRIKPEVCGPGNPIYSASSSGSPGNATCQVSQKSGSSMATPAVAGVAALLRQFLVDGMHEIYSSTGFAASDYDASHPSSALLKAMLIGSTMPLTSGYDSAGDSVTLAEFYGASSPVSDSAPYALGTTGVDYHQGFGHVLLSNVLSLDGEFDTFLYESSLDAYGSYTLQFEVDATSTEIDITLVWADPPGSEYCDYYGSGCLLHDLDLRVTHNGNRLYSNLGAASAGTYAGEEDTVNNVEKTTIPSSTLSAGDSIAIVVSTENGLAGFDNQKFALVITGNILVGTTYVPSNASTSSDTFVSGSIIGAIAAGLVCLCCACGGFIYSVYRLHMHRQRDRRLIDGLFNAGPNLFTAGQSVMHSVSAKFPVSTSAVSGVELTTQPKTSNLPPLRGLHM